MAARNTAKELKYLANHFAPRDWDYTRQHDIHAIRYPRDTIGYNSFWNRLKRGLFEADSKGMRALFGRERRRNLKQWWMWRVAWFRVSVSRDKNLPDGVLNGGSVITFWEEDGEYIQMVQPSVGSLLADFLLAEPEHPHAVIIRAELDRIAEGYTQRVMDGKVS